LIGAGNVKSSTPEAKLSSVISRDVNRLIYATAASMIARLPRNLRRAAFQTLADVSYFRRGKNICQLEENLAEILGIERQNTTLRSIVRANLRSSFRYLEESALLPFASLQDLPSPTQLIGGELIQEILKANRGIVIALPHMANWEQAGAYLSRTFGPVTSVATQFGPPNLYNSYIRTRRELGIELLPVPGAGEDRTGQRAPSYIFSSLAQRLKNGQIVCLLADRVVTGSSVKVQLFGQTASLPAGPATLAFHTGAALLPAALWYERAGWSGRVYEEVHPPQDGARQDKILQMTRGLSSSFESAIIDHIEDWHAAWLFNVSSS
jgi:phosphatidylinositol dimannoside acyltransferase